MYDKWENCLQLPVIMSKTIDIEWKQKLAEQIKQARESANLTQDELAKMLGISRQMVINYEKNKGVPAINVLAQIAVELEIRLRIKDLIITAERVSPRLRSVPKQASIGVRETANVFRSGHKHYAQRRANSYQRKNPRLGVNSSLQPLIIHHAGVSLFPAL